MIVVRLLAVSGLIGLSACGTGGGFASSPSDSKFTSVRSGQASASLDQERNRSVSEANVGTAAFVNGIDDDRGQVVSAAGFRESGTGVGSVVTNGTATYATSYGFVGAYDVDRIDTGNGGAFIRGTQFGASGNVTLTADFDNGTLTGSAGSLDFDGTINGSDLSGTVDVDMPGIFAPTLATTLDGEIGNNGVIGAFHGHNNDSSVAGGFVGTIN